MKLQSYTCQCDQFPQIAPATYQAADAGAAAVEFAEEQLPGPDPWGQHRTREYRITVRDNAADKLSTQWVHACFEVVFRAGTLL